MNARILLGVAGLAFLSLTAAAQTDTKTKVKIKTEGTVTDTTVKATKPVSAGPRILPAEKVIPVAEHYEGGQPAMYEFMNRELQYPMMAKRNRIQGEAIISVTINADGSTADMKILRNPGGGLGEEALRIVKQLKFKAPGYSVKAGVPVNFKL